MLCRRPSSSSLSPNRIKFICGECVQVCNEIIADEARFSRARDGSAAVADVKDDAEPHQIAEVPLSGPAVRCALCRLPTPVEDGLLIPNRGVLCPGCIGEIEHQLPGDDSRIRDRTTEHAAQA